VAETPRLIAASTDLEDSGRGLRFQIDYRGQSAPAFAVRYRGVVFGYLNRCRHVPIELDWNEAQFFGLGGHDLVCSTHGAVYSASSGSCLGGPCNGLPLVRLLLEERDNAIYYMGFADER